MRLETPEDPASVPSLVRSTPLPSASEQWSMKNKARQNLRVWEQELDEIRERQAWLCDRIEMARICISVGKAIPSRELDPNADPACVDTCKARNSVSEPRQHDLISSPSDSTLVDNGYHVHINTPPRPLSQTSLANSDLEMVMTGPSLRFTFPKEGIPSKIPPVSIEASGASEYDCLQRSKQLDGGARPMKCRRLSEKLIPKVHQNAPYGSLTREQSTPHVILDSAASFAQQWNQPTMWPHRNRSSRILLGQLSALQHEPQDVGLSSGLSPQPAQQVQKPYSERPVSYPQSRRWRKSLGISVRALREGFEKLIV